MFNRTLIISYFLFWLCFSAVIHTIHGQNGTLCSLQDPLLRAQCLLDSGHIPSAINFLDSVVGKDPRNKALNLLLAAGYFNQESYEMASEGLRIYLDRAPADRDIEQWLAWAFIKQAQFDKAEVLLNHSIIGAPPPITCRTHLLSSVNNSLLGKVHAGRISLQKATTAPAMYREDEALYRQALRLSYPGWQGPLSLSMSAGVGGSTKPITFIDTTTPTDKAGSPLLDIKSRLTWEPFPNIRWQPFSNLTINGLYYFLDEASVFSYAIPSFRAGFRFNARQSSSASGAFFIIPSYYFGSYILNQSPPSTRTRAPIEALLPVGTQWLYEFHRLELGLQWSRSFKLNLGAGRRIFSLMDHTRWEYDLTLSGPALSRYSLTYTGVVALHYHLAQEVIYNLRGGSVLFNIQRGFYSDRLLGFINLLLSDDYFPDFNDGTRDILFKRNPGIIYKASRRTKLEFSLEYNRRYSTRPGYSFTEGRVNLRWYGALRLLPKLPALAQEPGHIELPYNISPAFNPVETEDFEHLLEQSEDLEKGCGCTE